MMTFIIETTIILKVGLSIDGYHPGEDLRRLCKARSTHVYDYADSGQLDRIDLPRQ